MAEYDNDMVDYGSNGTQSNDQDSLSLMDEDEYESLSDVDFAPVPSQQGNTVPSSVPPLNIVGRVLPKGRPPVSIAGNEPISTTDNGTQVDNAQPLVVDVLISGYIFKEELVEKTQKERGQSPRTLVSAVFKEALQLEPDQLEFHQVVNFASMATEQSSGHIAVKLKPSEFSLSSMEELVRKSKRLEEENEDYKRRLAGEEHKVSRLRTELNDTKHKLREKESDNRTLLQDHERMRRGFPPQLSLSSTTHSFPTSSPRLLATGGAASQTHLHTNLAHLQRAVAENQQLVSDIAQVVTAQTVDYS